MRLIEMRYKTMKGEIKINGYNLHLPSEIVKKSTIDTSKELKVEIKNKELIIKEK